jgi:phosphate:Na+ symporter
MKKFVTILSLFVFGVSTVFSNQDTLINDSVGSSATSIDEGFKETIKIDESIFHNVSAKGIEEGAKIMWSIDYDIVSYLEGNNYSIVIASVEAIYIDKVTKDISALAISRGIDWKVEKGISIKETSFTIKELKGGTKYAFKVGVTNGDQTIFSKPSKFETERSWGLFKLLVLIGSLGMFIYGMKVMSEGLQQAAGDRLRNMLASITSNRVKGVFTGFGITSIVQSSSVTTVMTVSFVNAGLLTLRQSAGVMMGANIGTTITAWLILIFGFKVSLSSYALIFIAFGAPMIFFAKGKMKYWGAAIVGFALLFMGLGELKHSVPSLGADSTIVQFFADFKDAWYGPIMFVFLGALVTVIIQSSSAAMALTMTMVAAGAIPFEVASAMILGENIGTTITAELASIIGNVHAKRSARIHSLFNLIGVTWALLLFPFILKGIAYFIKAEGDPYTDPMAANLGLALFHTSFNTLNVLLLLPFTDKLVALAEKTVKSRGGVDEEFHLDYINSGLMVTPDLSILEAKKEVAKFAEITSRMSGFSQKLLTEQDRKIKTKLYEKISKYEEITDKVEVEIANYLAKVSEGEMTEKTSKRIIAMNSICNDLERIGDIFFQISKTIEQKDEKKIYFLPEQRNSLMEMFELIDKAFEVMVKNLNADWDVVTMDEATSLENAINKKRDEMRKEYLENMYKEGFNMESGMIFSNLFSNLEKVGDHIINVTEAVTGQI